LECAFLSNAELDLVADVLIGIEANVMQAEGHPIIEMPRSVPSTPIHVQAIDGDPWVR